jgi:hypothetical protein
MRYNIWFRAFFKDVQLERVLLAGDLEKFQSASLYPGP